MTTPEKVSTSASGGKKQTAGKTTIADSVVAVIAGIAARDVEGIHAMGGGATRAMGAVRDRVSRSSDPDPTRGVKVEVGEEQAAVDLDIVVLYGTRIADAAAEIRSSVTSAVQRMTGLEVVEININVRDVHVPGEDDDDDDESSEDTSRVR